MATRPGQEAVDREAQIPLFRLRISVEHRRQPRGAGGQRGVGGNPPDSLKVHCRERAAGVEAVPAEPQDQAPNSGDHEIVRQHWAAAVALEAPSQDAGQARWNRPGR